MLGEWLQDSDEVDKLLEHGCFCGKLDNTNPSLDHLGGTTTVDALDEICRDWLRARNCNDNLIGGSCQADRAGMRTGTYFMDIVTANYDISACSANAGCEKDTCEIDLVALKAIREYIDSNPNYTKVHVTGAGTCTPAPLDKRERRCQGTAPFVEPKRMSNLEQLMSRVDWNENDDVEDYIIYDAGGRKLDDIKEKITLAVKNQLIVFGWDNVSSMTFEVIEAANNFYVGWIEKPHPYNYNNGDHLGDDTKGGAKSIGIFSGDGSLHYNDGFRLNGNTDFFDAGDVVTIEHDNGTFKFYINGSLKHLRSFTGANAFAAAYPAIDMNPRLEVKITNVEYNE